MNDSATVTQMQPAAPVAPLAVSPERDAFELALRKSKVYASSTLVPAQYQDSIPNCLIALNMAKRIGADELQVMQNLYIVQGKPGWSGQFLIATFNQCGKFSALRFEWRGQQGDKDWACRAYATERATGERIVGSWVTWKMVEAEGWSKKNGSKWLTMPEQMFMYRAAAFLVRTHAPEIAMGLQTVEELRDVIDLELEPTPTKTDAVTAALKARLAAVQETLLHEAVPPPTYAEIRDAMEKATGHDGVDLAESLVDGAIPDETQRDELHVYATKRRGEIAK